MKGNRIATLALCLLVVSGMVLSGATPGGSAVGTASAATLFQDCDLADSLVGAFIQGILAPNEGGECRFNPDDQTDYSAMEDADAYSYAVGVQGSIDSYMTTRENFLTDSKHVATSKAKIEVINALNAGKSEATAQADAKAAVDAYYARMQANAVEDYNLKLEQMMYLQDTGITFEIQDANGNWVGPDGNRTNQFTLVNGSTKNHTDLYSSTGPTNTFSDTNIRVTNPTTGDTITVETSEYSSHMSNISTVHSNVRSNIDTYVTNVYANYSAGEIDSTDLAQADPGAVAYEAGTDANSTGYYGYAAIELAALGAGGDFNHSHTVEVLDSSNATTQTLEGTVFYTGDDVDSFQNGTIYDHDNLNGVVYMAVAKDDGSTAIVDLEDRGPNFRITEAVNTRTGETVNRTNVTHKTYDTFNASNLSSEIQKMRDLRDEYESMTAGAGGGSGGGGNSTLVIVVLAVGVGALLMRSKNQRGGGGRGRY